MKVGTSPENRLTPAAEPATWVLTAPSMQDGEYLHVQVLLDIWRALDS